MTSDLESGPDLGAGYLHQLSRDRDGATTTFTYHAQTGGQDANGPPRGELDVLGFVRPADPCMFGGPRCWHRRFLLPLEAAVRARAAYNRHRFVLDTQLRQAYDALPPTVDAGLQEVVARLAGPLEHDGVEWYVGGSAAAWLLGSGVLPAEIALGTTREGVDRIGELLREYLVEPVAPTDWPGRGVVHAARAFVGSFQAGVRVVWAAPLAPREPAWADEWSGLPGVAHLETATWRGGAVRASRPEYALVAAAEHGREGTLAEFVRRRGVDRALLEELLGRSELTEGRRAAVRRAVGVG